MTAPDMHPADRARALDRAYFQAHPTAKSYVRPYIEGECTALPPGVTVECVAVAFVSARVTVKTAILTGDSRRQARQESERLAHLIRGGTDRGVSA